MGALGADVAQQPRLALTVPAQEEAKGGKGGVRPKPKPGAGGGGNGGRGKNLDF